jgi:hypothetical protein
MIEVVDLEERNLIDARLLVRDLISTDKYYGIELDSAQTVHGLMKIPLISKYKFDSGLDYRLMSQAQEEEAIKVKETGNVSELEVQNQAKYPVLMPCGTLLISKKGGWQDRAITTDIIIGAGDTLKVPVACVEQYRWQSRSPAETARIFSMLGAGKSREDSDFHALNLVSPRVTYRFMDSIEKHLAEGYSGRSMYMADQHQVWDDVRQNIEEAGVTTPTQALTEVFVRNEEKTKKEGKGKSEFDIYDGEMGDIFIGSGRILGMELFETPDVWKNICEQTIKRYKLDITKEGNFDKKFLDGFLSNLSKCDAKATKSLGLGYDVRLVHGNADGACLVIGSSQRYAPAHLTVAPKNKDAKTRGRNTGYQPGTVLHGPVYVDNTIYVDNIYPRRVEREVEKFIEDVTGTRTIRCFD